jgi:hypothetical protein
MKRMCSLAVRVTAAALLLFVMFVFGAVVIWFLFGLIVPSLSHARDLTGHDYDSQPPEVRDWYQHAELTEAAQKRLGYRSCCAHSDVVHTRFRVSTVDGADEWQWLDGMQWRTIPADIIHVGESAPDGQATLFVLPGTGIATCFWPPNGGI